MGMTFSQAESGQLLEQWGAFPSSIAPSFVATWRLEATLDDTPKISSVIFGEAVCRESFSVKYKMVEVTNVTNAVEVSSLVSP